MPRARSPLCSALVRTDEAGADGEQRHLGAALGPRHVLEPEEAGEQVEFLRDDLGRDSRVLGDLEVAQRVQTLAVGEQRFAERAQDALLLLRETRGGGEL